MFSMQHSPASRALAPAFDQWCPNRLSGLLEICLRAPSRTRIRPENRVRRGGRSQSPHCVGRVFESMALIEDENRIPSGEDLLADIPDPCCPVRQHQLLGSIHAVPEPEQFQAPTANSDPPTVFRLRYRSVRTPESLGRSSRGRTDHARRSMNFSFFRRHKEWCKLRSSFREQFSKKLAERLKNPRVSTDVLH